MALVLTETVFLSLTRRDGAICHLRDGTGLQQLSAIHEV